MTGAVGDSSQTAVAIIVEDVIIAANGITRLPENEMVRTKALS